jgi:hypothetical protein
MGIAAYIPDKRFLCKERHHARWVSPPAADQPNLLDKFLGDSLHIDILPAKKVLMWWPVAPWEKWNSFFPN